MQRFCVVLLFCFLFCASVFSQDRGVIQCGPNYDRVPAWAAPGSPYLVEYLPCGQMVSVTGFERDYARIQMGGRIAYVQSKYVRIIQAREPWRPFGRRSSAPPTVPVASVFFGYSYLNFSTNGLTDSRQQASGWDASVSSNFNQWFALELDVSGHYKNYNYYTGNAFGLPRYISVAAYRDYSYLAGPRVNYGPVFIHALFGGDRLSGSALGTPSAQIGFAGALGGGIQYPVNDLVAFRVGADYIFATHNVADGSSATNNNFRASLGVVFNLGSRRVH